MFDLAYRYQIFHQSQPSDFNFKMSTVRDYYKALEGENLDNLHEKDGDYLPFVSIGDNNFASPKLKTVDVWSGFYVTHPFLKKKIYNLMRFLTTYQNHESLVLGSKLRNHKDLYKLEETVSVLIHHDGITGTNTIKVYYDYLRMANEAVESLENVVAKYNPALKGFKVEVLDQYFKLYEEQQLAVLNPYGQRSLRMNIRVDCHQKLRLDGKDIRTIRVSPSSENCFVLEELELSDKGVTQVNLEATGGEKEEKEVLKKEAMEKLDKLEYKGYKIEVVSDVHTKRTVRFMSRDKPVEGLELELGIYNQKNDDFKKSGHYATRIDEVFYHKPQIDWHY